MPNFIVTWLVTAISLLITSNFVPGFEVKTFTAALIAAVILGLANAIVRPFLVLLTLPLTILSLGGFLLVINAITLMLVSAVTQGFHVTFLSALIGSIVLTIVSSVINFFVKTEEA
jgi:putative membrane protein